MSNYKISIIVPVYNQEKYLKDSIQSIINQNIGFENIELILVDDCSTDKSKSIIKEFSNKYSNIKPIFLEKNSGAAGIPKNKGIEIATTPYLMFFDPDDYLFDDICKTLYEHIIETKADIVSGNAIVMIGNDPYVDIDFSNDIRKCINPSKKYSEFKNFRIWGSIFSKELILDNNIRFLDKKTNEDTYFAQKAFFKANKICYLDDYYGQIYFIRQNNSLTHNFSKTNLISTIEAFIEIKKLLIEMDLELDQDYFLKNIYYRFESIWNTTKDEEIEVYKKMLDYRNENYMKTNLTIQHKVFDKLLANKNFELIYLAHKIYASFINSRFFKKFLKSNTGIKGKIAENDKIHEKLKDIAIDFD